MIKVSVFIISKRVLIAGKHRNPIQSRKRNSGHSGIVDDNSKINKQLGFTTRCSTMTRGAVGKKVVYKLPVSVYYSSKFALPYLL